MKSAKKAKQPIFLNIQKNDNKIATQNSANSSSSTEHRKLLEYRDYLLSLRKMDLGSLIKKSENKKKQQLTKANDKQNFASHSKSRQKLQDKENKTIFTSNPQNLRQSSEFKQIKGNVIIKGQDVNIKGQNVNIKGHATKPPGLDIHKAQKQQKRQFQLKLKAEIRDDDLYCDEDMDELMDLKVPATPKLLHISNFSSNHKNDRDFQTHRSSRCRDFSMPSIEERNLSEESEESLGIKQRNRNHSTSHRKYSSCAHASPFNQQKEDQQRSKINSKNQICLTLRTKTKIQLIKTFQKDHLLSTKDVNTNSANKSQKNDQKSRKNITVNPFTFKTELNAQKQSQKISLNVSQIVKRISSRQSKSSMSDKSYKKNKQNAALNDNKSKNFQGASIFSQNNVKKLKVDFDNSPILSAKNNMQSFHIIKKKSFKTQVRQFREKNYLLMKLDQ